MVSFCRCVGKRRCFRKRRDAQVLRDGQQGMNLPSKIKINLLNELIVDSQNSQKSVLQCDCAAAKVGFGFK